MLHEENVLGVFQILWFQKKLLIALALFSLIFPLSLSSKSDVYFRNSIHMSLNHDFFNPRRRYIQEKTLVEVWEQIANDYNRICNEIRHNLYEFENAFYSVIGSGKLNVSLNEGKQGDKKKHPQLLKNIPMSVSKIEWHLSPWELLDTPRMN